MGYSLGKKIRGRLVRRLQGGGGENEQWRRAANLIPAHLPVDVATIQPERRGPQTLEEENETNKSGGEMKGRDAVKSDSD